ncbi:MAG: endolytic transglycosylase MltG [Clostridia bacterium]|nr:endolytic transglycosylase MltG [Clostridia bacterium]
MKKRKALLIALAVLLVLLIGSLAALVVLGGDMTIDEDREIIVAEGSSTVAITDQLYQAGLIKSEQYFRLYARMNKMDNHFQAGTYQFSAGKWNIEAVCNQLLSGAIHGKGEMQVTIVEGLTVKQIAQTLANAGFGTVDNYLQYAATGDFSQYEYIPAQGTEIAPATRLEGFLFPDTYWIDPKWSEADIIDMLLAQFASVWRDNGFDKLAAAAEHSVYDVVTMAALVEKEAQVAADRPLIAGVFYKRLALGMKLESCATVQFILGEPKERLTNRDTQIDNPYNAYVYAGLPPGPIACPGKASLEAALNPTISDYLYFRAKTDGSHRFSVTFEEHAAYHEGDQ